MNKQLLKNKIIEKFRNYPHWEWLLLEGFYFIFLVMGCWCAVGLVSSFLHLEHSNWSKFGFAFGFIDLFYCFKVLRWLKREFTLFAGNGLSFPALSLGQRITAAAGAIRDEWADVIGNDENNDE